MQGIADEAASLRCWAGTTGSHHFRGGVGGVGWGVSPECQAKVQRLCGQFRAEHQQVSVDFTHHSSALTSAVMLEVPSWCSGWGVLCIMHATDVTLQSSLEADVA